MPSIDEILKQTGRAGWTYGRPVAETKQVPGQYGGSATNEPTGRYILNISDGKGHNQKVILRTDNLVDVEPGWVVEEAPEALPKPTADTPADKITDPYGGVYVKNPATGQYEPQVQGSQGAYEKSLTEAAEAKRKLEEIQANKLATGFSLTDQQVQQLQLDKEKQGLDAATLKQRAAEFQTKNANDIEQLRIASRAETRLAGSADAQNALVRAQTAGVGVETATNEERLRQLIAMGPAAERQAILNNEVTEAQLEAAKQKLKQPTVLGQQTGAYMTTMTPEGQIEQKMSLGYQPKTMADVQARAGQIQAAANAKKAEVMSKVGQNGYTAERALAEFNQWYDQNVQSQIAGLQAAGEEAQLARGREAAESRRQSYQQALGAGAQAINAYQAEGVTRAGAGAPEFMRKATEQGNLKGLDWSNAAFSRGSPLQDRAAKATQEALRDIDPSSAQATGRPLPDYSQFNAAEMLARSKWELPGATAPVPAATTGGGATTGGDTPAPADPWAEWRARQAADAALQQRQALVPQPVPQQQPPPVEEPVPPPAAAFTPMQAAVQKLVTPRVVAPAPVAAAAPPTPEQMTPGFGYDPSAMAGRQAVPGFGYDPSNIAVAPPPPQPDYMSMIPPPQPLPPGDFSPYDLSVWQPPTNPVIAAAQGAYAAVPRTRNWRGHRP